MPINSNPPADPLNNPYGIGGYGSGLLGNAPIENMPISYYAGLLSSEYQPPSSPKWNAFLQLLLKKFDDASQCLVQMDTVFDLDYAVGVQLDVLGVIAGVSRTVPFQPTGNGQGNAVLHGTGVTWSSEDQFNTSGLWNGQQLILTPSFGSPTQTIVSVTSPTTMIVSPGVGAGFISTFYQVIAVSPTLDDATYRTLIKATIAQNQWDGTITGLQPIWENLFPGGTIIIADNQNMTANIILAGTFSSIIQDLITNGMIVPRPEGVLYNYVFGDFPKFGADLNNAYVAGADIGHTT